MNPYTQLIALLTSPSSMFFCTESEMAAALLSVIHISDKFVVTDSDFPTYRNRVSSEVKPLIALAENQDISVTVDYASRDINPHSIAYHPVKGLIMAESYWYFSSKQFEQDLLAAESNPNINAHFLHIKSGGGEAWYLDKVAETLTGLSKPIYTFAEKVMASAAYYIGVHGDVIKSNTQNDTIGSIGTMVDGFDFITYFEKMGLKRIKALATRSDLKNKKSEDLRNGKPEQFIREELDPLQQQFESAVRAARPQLNDLPDDDPVFRGETFSATKAIEKNMISALTTLPEALAEVAAMGKDWADKQTNRNLLLSHL